MQRFGVPKVEQRRSSCRDLHRLTSVWHYLRAQSYSIFESPVSCRLSSGVSNFMRVLMHANGASIQACWLRLCDVKTAIQFSKNKLQFGLVTSRLAKIAERKWEAQWVSNRSCGTLRFAATPHYSNAYEMFSWVRTSIRLWSIRTIWISSLFNAL